MATATTIPFTRNTHSRSGGGRGERGYRNLRRGERCPICDRPDWCQVRDDGNRITRAACKECNSGPWFKWTNLATGSHIHIIGGGASSVRPERKAKPKPDVEPAEIEVRDRAYRSLIGILGLSDAHRESMLKRGLTPESIRAGMYATLGMDRRGVARKVREAIGSTDEQMLFVPGFFMRTPDGGGEAELSIGGQCGIIVPTFNLAGQVVGLEIRADKVVPGRGKYTWFTSRGKGGAGLPVEAHHPIHAGSKDVVRLTEGNFKSTIAQQYDNVFTISIPGVNSWPKAMATFKAVNAKSVRLAFDADFAVKPTVCGALLSCMRRIVAEGYAVEMDSWDEADGKGLDDLLAAGKVPTVLSSREAAAVVFRAARAQKIQEVVQPLDVLPWVRFNLESGGPAAFWADSALVNSVTRMFMGEDIAAFAGVEEIVREHKRVLPVGRFLADIKKHAKRLREEDRRLKSVRLNGGSNGAHYEESEGYTYRIAIVDSQDGPREVRELLSRWTARIVEEVNRHEAGAIRKQFLIHAVRPDGATADAVVDAKTFGDMAWVAEQLGSGWIVEAGRAIKDHLRVAIQVLSAGDGVATADVHTSTGWIKIGDQWIYLHAGGAIGNVPAESSLRVEVQPALSRYRLPAPPQGESLEKAVAACVRILDLGKDSRRGAPGVAAVLASLPWRSVLGPMNSVIHFSGGTGTRKTSAALLAFAHFALGVARRGDRPPVSWSSTPGSLQRYAYDAKDTLLVVDELTGDRATAAATEFIQAQGNLKGRDRMAQDFRLAPSLDPRGAVLSTGEGDPTRQSALGRMLTLGFHRETIDVDVLGRCQADAESGAYAAAMAGFVRWLSQEDRIDSARVELASASLEIAAAVQAATEGKDVHPRHPAIVGELVAAYRIFMRFAVESGCLAVIQADAYAAAVQRYLISLAEDQGQIQRQSSPAQKFIDLVVAGLASGRYHLERSDSDFCPTYLPRACGWEKSWIYNGTDQGQILEWKKPANSKRLGFIDQDKGLVYLEPGVAKELIVDVSRRQGENLENSGQIGRDLLEAGVVVPSQEGTKTRADAQIRIRGAGKVRCYRVPIVTLFGEEGRDDDE